MLKPHDTSEAAWAVQVAIWQRMGTDGRLAAAAQMIAFSRDAALDAIRGRHPDYDERTARLALFRMIYGDALVTAAWPNEPLREP